MKTQKLGTFFWSGNLDGAFSSIGARMKVNAPMLRRSRPLWMMFGSGTATFTATLSKVVPQRPA